MFYSFSFLIKKSKVWVLKSRRWQEKKEQQTNKETKATLMKHRQWARWSLFHPGAKWCSLNRSNFDALANVCVIFTLDVTDCSKINNLSLMFQMSPSAVSFTSPNRSSSRVCTTLHWEGCLLALFSKRSLFFTILFQTSGVLSSFSTWSNNFSLSGKKWEQTPWRLDSWSGGRRFGKAAEEL